MSNEELNRIRSERDLYGRLLALAEDRDPERFVREALALVVDIAAAEQGYLEVGGGSEGAPMWSVSTGLSGDELQNVRVAVSRGIIAEALATSETIHTSSAALDPRFSEQESVREHAIRAVLCVPVGREPPIGVVYLSKKQDEAFTESDIALSELFGRSLAPLADRLAMRSQLEATTDHTRQLRQTLKADGVVGTSRSLATHLKDLALVAPLDVSVLLTGGSGSGKSASARLLHNNSPRVNGPFLELNCATLQDTLIESELFGAAQGAHSTATKRTDGKVAAAEGGTLFLDEIGELTPRAQAKLLQLLHDRTYFRVGETKRQIADVRIIAATNRDLGAAIAERQFREDLYYRLNVMPVRVPSLAERREDIPLLVDHGCRAAARRHHLAPIRVSLAASRSAAQAEWPGNVRQLLHAVEAAVIRAAGEGASALTVAHLFPDRATAAGEVEAALSFQEATRHFQAQLVVDTLEECDWNISAAANRLSLHRSHVHNLINDFGLKRARRE